MHNVVVLSVVAVVAMGAGAVCGYHAGMERGEEWHRDSEGRDSYEKRGGYDNEGYRGRGMMQGNQYAVPPNPSAPPTTVQTPPPATPSSTPSQ